MTDKKKSITAVVAVFSLILSIPLLALSPTGFELNNNFVAMAQEQASSSSSSNQTEIVVAQTPEEQANLDRFDKLDFEAWNNRNWTLFEEIHSPDVLVVDGNGNTTRGIDQHLQWAMTVASAQPESRVLAHPIKIAAGDWTAVTGLLPGNLTSVTIAHWEDGRITEEYLFLQSPPAPMMMNSTRDSQ
ncbi:MAG: nuclear transport factor 2 family protein [Thermoproteota archaeon]|nr:nuclear transport factor 2 family protein [Thermoproteota archaeon]